MFSVIIPLYNKESQIQKTLNTVLEQTYSDFEVVIVNDGSTDRSAEIIRSNNDFRLRLINQENQGVSAARNKGIKEARNEWIAFLDADDIWDKSKLEKISEIIEKNKRITWLLSGYNTIKNNKKYDYVYPQNGFLIDALDDLNNGLSIQTSTVVVKRKCFMEDYRLFFKEGLNHSEDREVWYRLIFRYPNPYYISLPLTYYIIDESGKSLNSQNKQDLYFLYMFNRLSDDFNLLTKNRLNKFKSFIEKFNKKAIWNKWASYGWNEAYAPFIKNKTDFFIMKSLSKVPKSIRLIVKKITV